MNNGKKMTIANLAILMREAAKQVKDGIEKFHNELRDMNGEVANLRKDQKLMQLDMETIRLRLDNVAYRFELKELGDRLDKKIEALEMKLMNTKEP